MAQPGRGASVTATCARQLWVLNRGNLFFAGNDYGVATTYASKVRATYYGDKGTGSVTAYLVVNGAAATKTKAWMPWRQARMLQLIPDAKRRDHVPVVYDVPVRLGGFWRPLPPPQMRWDYDKLAECLQRGKGRVAFLAALQEAFTDPFFGAC